MYKYSKEAQSEWVNNLDEWEDKKEVGSIELRMMTAFSLIIIMGYIVGSL